MNRAFSIILLMNSMSRGGKYKLLGGKYKLLHNFLSCYKYTYTFEII